MNYLAKVRSEFVNQTIRCDVFALNFGTCRAFSLYDTIGLYLLILLGVILCNRLWQHTIWFHKKAFFYYPQMQVILTLLFVIPWIACEKNISAGSIHGNPAHVTYVEGTAPPELVAGPASRRPKTSPSSTVSPIANGAEYQTTPKVRMSCKFGQ